MSSSLNSSVPSEMVVQVTEAKAQGNALFKDGSYTEANSAYTKAIDLCGGGGGGALDRPTRQLKATLYTNRAAAQLKLSRHDQAIEDCTAALDLDDTAAKALYRRAEAYAAKDQLAAAFRDAKRLLQIEPKNKPAAKLALRLKEQLQKEALGVGAALRGCAAAAAKAGADRDGAAQAFGGLAYRCSTDAPFCAELVQRGGIAQLVAAAAPAAADGGGYVLRLVANVLGAICAHRHLAVPVAASCPAARLTALAKSNSDDEGARAALRFFGACARACAEASEAAPADAVPREAAQRVRAGAYAAAIAALAPRSRAELAMGGAERAAVLGGALDLILRVCSSQQAAMELEALGGLRAVFEVSASSDRHVVSKVALVLRSVIAQLTEEQTKAHVGALCGAGFGSADKDMQLKAASMLSALFLVKPELAAWALGETKAMPTLVRMAGSGVPWLQSLAVDVLAKAAAHKDSRAHFSGPALEVLQHLLGAEEQAVVAGAASAMAKMSISSKAYDPEDPDGSRLFHASVENLQRRRADPKKKKKPAKGSGKAAEEEEQTAHPLAQAVVAERAVETLTSLVSDYAVKEQLVAGVGLQRLVALAEDVDDDDASSSSDAAGAALVAQDANRNRAALAYGLAHIFMQLTVTQRQLKSRSIRDKEYDIEEYEQLEKLQNMHLAKQREEEDLPAERDQNVDTDEAAERRCVALVEAGGVAALVRLAADTDVSWRTMDLIGQILAAVAAVVPIRTKVVQQGGLKLLLKLMARDTRSTAEREERRRKGGEAKPTDIATDPDGKDRQTITADGVEDASQAVARLLISTDPRLLAATQQKDVIPPLLTLCAGPKQLLQFEASMALTNLASASHELREFMVARKAVGTLTYLQFSENEMVQRAATEALCNLVAHPEVARQIIRGGDRTRLWVALCETWEEQPATATAAAGALATLAQMHGAEVWVKGPRPAPEAAAAEGATAAEASEAAEAAAAAAPAVEVVSETAAGGEEGHVEELDTVGRLTEIGAPAVLVELAETEDPGLQHRAVVAMQCMCEVAGAVGDAARRALVSAGAKKALAKLQDSRVAPVMQGARELVRVLKSVRGDANNYKRFEGLGDEEADEVEDRERDQLQHNIALLAEKLSEEEQAVIMAAATPEEQARLLQEAIAKHPELGMAAAAAADDGADDDEADDLD